MPTGQSHFSRKRLLFFYTGTFLFWASLYVYVPILSVYARSAGASLSIVGWVVGSYGITQLMLRIPMGIVSDRWGRRKPFILGGAMAAAIGCLGLAALPHPYAMIFSRAIIGVGAATWVLFTTLFASYFPPERTTWALGSLTFSASAALVIAAPLGGWLAEDLGWTAPFAAGTVLAIASLLFLLPSPEPPPSAGSSPPLKDLAKVAATPFLIIISVVALFEQFMVFTTVFSFTPIYAASLGASKVDLGILLTATLLPRALGTLAAAPLASRIGERSTVSLGLVVASLSALAVPHINSLPLLAASQMLLGMGIGFSYPTLMGLSINAVPPRHRATAMGVFQAIYALGMSLGPILSGMLADRAGIASTFYLASIPCLISAIAVGFFLRVPPGKETSDSRPAVCEVSCPGR
jgi:MFS family permease